jgi:hypothetical protein
MYHLGWEGDQQPSSSLELLEMAAELFSCHGPLVKNELLLQDRASAIAPNKVTSLLAHPTLVSRRFFRRGSENRQNRVRTFSA